MGKTRADLLHLLEDLRDAYPGYLEETILTEVVANALDSGARTFRLETNPESATLLAADDGAGMSKRALQRYHDLAATTKRRGHGIGFAGVGIKLGLLACDEVVTETRAGRTHAATSWRLAHRTKAPWAWIDPPHSLRAKELPSSSGSRTRSPSYSTPDSSRPRCSATSNPFSNPSSWRSSPRSIRRGCRSG